MAVDNGAAVRYDPAMDTFDYAGAIRNTVARATGRDWLEGAEWYDIANRTAREMATEYGATLDNAARIIAVLSPRKRWAQNVAAAREILRAWSAGEPMPSLPGTLRANIVKAWAIANGDPSALRGPKVERFYANIMGDDSQVTLDVWAMRAAGSALDAPNGERMYAIIADAYRTVAREHGIPVAALQAVAWIVIRGKGN